MVVNNVIVVIFLIYMVLLPLFVSFNGLLDDENFYGLFVFDIIFILDRCMDLFVGYYQEDG